MTDDEIKAVKEEASEFLTGAKANGKLEAYATEKEQTSTTATYGADYADDSSASLPKEVYEAADKLEENGFAEIIETDSAIYVVQLESAFDTDATATEKETILKERQDKEVTDTIEKWRKDTKIEVNEKVWGKVSMHDIQVTEKKADTEDNTENNTENTNQDTTTDDNTADDTTDNTTEE